MKKILIILFPFSLLAQKVDTIMIFSLNQSLWVSHDSLVAESFKLGYKSVGSQYSGVILHSNSTRAQAREQGAKLFIKSYTGFLGDTLSAFQEYQNGMLSVMPAGSNNFIQVYNGNNKLSNQISTGAGLNSNYTGYDIEFFGIDPFNNPMLSSFSNGYVAGQLAKIKDSLNCSWWEARYRARQTASNGGIWTAQNGYGKIDIIGAINYNGVIPSDLYMYEPPPPPPYYSIILQTNPVGSGILSGAGSFIGNSNRTVSATTIGNNLFLYWKENDSIVSTNSTYSFTLNSDKTLTAYFTEYIPSPIVLGKFQNIPTWYCFNEKPILFWDIVAGAEKYKIYRRLKTDRTWTFIDETIDSFYKDTTITRARTSYKYKIVAELGNEKTESQEFNIPFLKYERFFYKKE